MHIERIVFLDASPGVDIERRLDRRLVASAAAPSAPARAAGCTRARGDRRTARAEGDAPGRGRRRRSLLPNDVRDDRTDRVALPVHLQRSATADEEDAPVLDPVGHVDLAVGKGHEEVVVQPRDRKRVRDHFAIRVRDREKRPARRGLERDLVVGVHEPVRDVDVMRAPIADHAAAVGVPRAEPQARGLERPLGRVQLPQIPVQPGRDRLLRLLHTRVGPGLHDRHVRDCPERAGVDDLLGLREMIPAALVRADLDDLLALLVGVEHRVDPRDAV